MKRLLALVGEAYGGVGGIGQYNRDFFEALSAGGGHDILILPRHGRHTGALPAHVTQEKPTPGRLACVTRALAAAARFKPQIVFCGHLFMAPLAALVARLHQARLVIQLHGIEAWQAPAGPTRRAVEGADLVLCVSRDTRSRVLGWCDLPAERAVVASNTVGAAFVPGDRAVARARFGLGAEKVLLSVSRLDARERYKGHDKIIAVLSTLAEMGLRPTYLIAGEGDDRPRLEALAARGGCGSQVRFLGAVPAADLADLYRAADLFVLPSTGEGFGIVFLEAMACGTPALGLDAGGASDALSTSMSTIATPPTLAEDVVRALGAPLAADGVAEVSRHFGQVAFSSRINSLMNRLDDDHPAAA